MVFSEAPLRRFFHRGHVWGHKMIFPRKTRQRELAGFPKTAPLFAVAALVALGGPLIHVVDPDRVASVDFDDGSDSWIDLS